MATYRFVLYKSTVNNNYYFNFKAPNNEIMFQSEGYVSKASAQSAIATIRREVPSSGTIDLTASAIA